MTKGGASIAHAVRIIYTEDWSSPALPVILGFSLTLGEICLSEIWYPPHGPYIMVGYPRVGLLLFLVLAISCRSPWVELVVGWNSTWMRCDLDELVTTWDELVIGWLDCIPLKILINLELSSTGHCIVILYTVYTDIGTWCREFNKCRLK